MKTKNKKMGKKSVFLLAAVSFVALLSCSRDLNEPNVQFEKKVCQTKTPVYSSFEELRGIVEHASNLDNLEDLVSYEESQGRESIGRLSDLFYYSIDPETFDSENSILFMYEDNQLLLDTMTIENGTAVLPKWYGNDYRYVADINGDFIVNGELYNIADFTQEVCENEQLISNDLMIQSSIFPNNHEKCDYSSFIRNHTANGDNQIVLKILTVFYPFDSPDRSELNDIYEVKVTVLNLHKVLGIWWEKKFFTTLNGAVRIHVKEEDDDDWRILLESVTELGKQTSSISKVIYSSPITPRVNSIKPHIYGYEVSALAEGIGEVKLVGGRNIHKNI